MAETCPRPSPGSVEDAIPQEKGHTSCYVYGKGVEMGDSQGGPVMGSQGFKGTAVIRCNNGSGDQRGERLEDATLWL